MTPVRPECRSTGRGQNTSAAPRKRQDGSGFTLHSPRQFPLHPYSLLVVVADPGLVCGGCRACHPPQAGEADGVAQAVAGQSLECAAVAGWNGHEVDALSGALVQDLLDRYGTGLPGALFSRVAQGLPFDEALRRTTGATLIDVGEAFWARQSVLKRWLPVITSTAVLWFGITLLAIVAALK